MRRARVPEGAAAPRFAERHGRPTEASHERAAGRRTEQRYYDPEIQTMPLERVRALQAERLARQLDRIWATPVPFFKRKLEAAGLRRADLRGPRRPGRASRRRSKPSCARARTAYPPFGDYRGAPASAAVRLGASTGTSGRPTLILWTRKDLEVDHAASARGRWRWGLRPGMSLANAHPVRHERGRLALQPRRRGARRAEHPVGPAGRRGSTSATSSRCGGASGRTCTGCSATSPTTYADAARGLGLDPARDLNLTIAGDHPSEQYLMASSGLEALPLLGSACDERDGAHLAEDLAIVEVIDRHTGRALRSRRARQPGGHRAGEGQLPPALRPRGRGAAQRDAVPLRRDAPAALLRGSRARRRAAPATARCCRSTWRSSCTSSPRSRRRRPSTRSCVPLRPSPELHVRCEHRRRGRSGPAGAAASPSASASGSAWRRGSSSCRRGGLPRFAYKAARVVDA